MRTTNLKKQNRGPRRGNLKSIRHFAMALLLTGILINGTGCAAIAEGIVEGIGAALVDGLVSGIGEAVGDDDSCHETRDTYAHYERTDGGSGSRDRPGRGR